MAHGPLPKRTDRFETIYHNTPGGLFPLPDHIRDLKPMAGICYQTPTAEEFRMDVGKALDELELETSRILLSEGGDRSERQASRWLLTAIKALREKLKGVEDEPVPDVAPEG